MGEYANYGRKRIKIGTCETMYYLRADQVHKVTPEYGSVNPAGRDADRLLFRFPFPFEDDRSPGNFEPFVTFRVHNHHVHDGVEHNRTQFVSERGFNVMLECPESIAGEVFSKSFSTIHRNGYGGAVRVAYQRIWEGKLVTVCECGGCGALYRLPTWDDVESLVAAIRSEGDRCSRAYPPDESRAKLCHAMADRITRGYLDPPEWVATGFPATAKGAS